ncbi:ATPase/histidine kinase/DNA gyrase B/HSP90 domain protein [Bacteroidales bacterium KA00344]|nr:ATPase/histidine kinase/DNA gyrase B/HSP90 domain protein [Bacteroidales bacterium KA00344]
MIKLLSDSFFLLLFFPIFAVLRSYDMMKKLIYLLLFLSLLTSCQQQSRKFVIGVSQCSIDIWRDKLNRELKTSEYFNDSIEVRLASANDDSKKQIAQIDKFVDDGVDLLIVAPNQYTSITRAVNRAYDKGIPVILYDRKVNTDKYTAFIGGDNYNMGKTMGQFIARQLKGRGRVVEIRGLDGSSPAEERHRGFLDGLKAFPGVQLVASESGNWKEESAIDAMNRILRKTRNFDYVFGQNDRMAWGAYVALKQHGLERQVKFTGIDGMATEGGGLELVRDGLFEASYLYPTKGDEVIALAMSILRRQPFKRENPLTTTIVTRDNAELLLMQAKDMERQNVNLDIMHKKVDSYFNQYTMQRWFIVVLIGALALIAIAILVTYRAYLSKARLSMQLADSNHELQRLNDEVKAMTQAQLTFFTNVSHELRTPLTLIADPVDRLLESGKTDEDGRKMLRMVQRNVHVLMQLVNEILDFRKVQNGKMTLRLTRFSLGTALQEWCGAFASAAENANISLKTESDVGDDDMMIADEEKLNHLYLNLMSNALKYTPAGGTITTTLGREGDCYVIRVEDTGVGIEKKDLANIFGRFYQGREASGGTGIGLALVKAFAELHHGEVSVESEKGRGTCFTVKLPIRQEGAVEESLAPAASVEVAAGQYVGTQVNTERHTDDVVSVEETDKPEILVIDDNNDVRAYLRSVLKDQYHVSEAVDGRSGLILARRIVPDIVVCDVMMPVMDGLTFTREMKSHTATSHIPVILLTARSLNEQMAEGYETGADSYIIKPFSAKVLLARISNLLKNRAQLRQLFANGEARTSLPNTAPDGAETASGTVLGDRDKTFIARLRDIIQQNLHNSDLSVEQIGEEIGLSRVQLYRKVKALTGHSPVELLRTARLQRGRKLLETTDQTVSEVAYAVGFTSPSYFTKCFKDEFNVSPSELNG